MLAKKQLVFRVKELTPVFKLLPKIYWRLGQYWCGRHGQQEQAHGCHGDELLAGYKTTAFSNKSQLWWLIILCNLSSARGGRGSAVCSPVQWGYSGQTPKRRRGSPLGSEQMSEYDWFSALTLNRGSVTVSANQRAGNAFSAVANLCGQWQQTTRCPDTRPRKADAPKVNMNTEKSQRGRINQCKISTTMFVWFSCNQTVLNNLIQEYSVRKKKKMISARKRL